MKEIVRKVDVDRFLENGSGRYYQQIRWDLTRKTKGLDDFCIIFKPNKPITEKFIIDTLIHLQLEFTENVIVPEHDTDLSEGDLEEILKRLGKFFNCNPVYLGGLYVGVTEGRY